MNSSIKERPILFSGPMVRALLSGQKTVTRRAMKPQPVLNGNFWEIGGAGWSAHARSVTPVAGHSLAARCPYGRPGDRLWVRETWYCDHFEVQRGPYLKPDDMDLAEARDDGMLVYAADGLTPYEAEQPVWKPSIHMPRWASRILLEVAAVRVERLQDITVEQIIAEGLTTTLREQDAVEDLKRQWRELWTSLNGTDSWNSNPWVWVLEFKRVSSGITYERI